MCKAGFYWRAVKVVQCGVKNVVAHITAGAVAKVNRAALLLQAFYKGVRWYGGKVCRRGAGRYRLSPRFGAFVVFNKRITQINGNSINMQFGAARFP